MYSKCTIVRYSSFSRVFSSKPVCQVPFFKALSTGECWWWASKPVFGYHFPITCTSFFLSTTPPPPVPYFFYSHQYKYLVRLLADDLYTKMLRKLFFIKFQILCFIVPLFMITLSSSHLASIFIHLFSDMVLYPYNFSFISLHRFFT